MNIFNSVPSTRCLFQPLFSHTHKDRLGPSSTAVDIRSCWQEFGTSQDAFALMQNEWFNGKDGKSRLPQFEKSMVRPDLIFKHVRYHHLILPILERDPQVKFILVVRDPRATINSFLNSAEFDAGGSHLEQWRWAPLKNQDRPEEFYGYEKWKQAVRLFSKASKDYPDRVRLVRYVDLLHNLEFEIKNLFEFVDLEFGAPTQKFLSDSQRRPSGDYGVYRKKANDLAWIDQLDQQIAVAIESDVLIAENADLHRFLDHTAA